MKVRYIGCASSKNEVEWLHKQGLADYEFLDYSYHANPRKLREKLQEIIDNSQDYDLIILGYGRCSNSLVGLVSPNVPMIFPDTHDCFGLLLGSNEKYSKLVKESVGTYFFSQGWLDYGRNPYEEYLEYKARYGENKARMLMDSLYGRYNKALFIKTPGMRDVDHYRKRVKEIADFFGWSFKETQGDVTLLSSLLACDKAEGTIYIKPGEVVNESHFNHAKN